MYLHIYIYIGIHTVNIHIYIYICIYIYIYIYALCSLGPLVARPPAEIRLAQPTWRIRGLCQPATPLQELYLPETPKA